MELLSQFLYSENICSTVIGSHLENSRHFEKKQVANGFYQTNTLRGVPMPTFMLVPQSERFCLNRKLKLFYKIYNGLAPQNLHDLIPPTIQSTSIYPLHNGSDLIVPFCRLSSMNSSFTPSVREWNKLENSVRNLDIPLKFKRALSNNANEINIVPKHFMYGPRKLNVILTQLRCSASILNNDVFKLNIVSSPKCYVLSRRCISLLL